MGRKGGSDMASNTYRGPLLYLVVAVALMALLLLAVRVVNPSGSSPGDGEAVLVSPQGRIQIHLVTSYGDSERASLSVPDVEIAAPSAVYVPSYLPEGLELANTRLLTPTSPEQLFAGEGRVLSVLQDVSATQIAKVGAVEEISVDGRPGFLVRGGWTVPDKSARWDVGERMTLLLEVEDGGVIVQGEGDWLTRLEMVRIAGSLDPDQDVMAALTERGRGIFPQSVIDALGPTFGPLYEPGYVPKGYVPQGSPYAIPTIMERVGVGIRQIALNNEVILPYMSHHCQLSVHQHRRGSGRGPNIARRAIEYPSDSVVKVTPEGTAIYGEYRAEFVFTHGIELYVSGPVLMPNPEGDHTSAEYWFEREGTWFSIETWAWVGCDTLSLNEIARIAGSLAISS